MKPIAEALFDAVFSNVQQNAVILVRTKDLSSTPVYRACESMVKRFNSALVQSSVDASGVAVARALNKGIVFLCDNAQEDLADVELYISDNQIRVLKNRYAPAGLDITIPGTWTTLIGHR